MYLAIIVFRRYLEPRKRRHSEHNTHTEQIE